MMKKIFSYCLLAAVAMNANSQSLSPIAQKITEQKSSGKEFYPVNLLALTYYSDAKRNALNKTVPDITCMEFNESIAQELLKTRSENIEFIIPLVNGKKIALELYRVQIFTPDFTVVAASGAAVQNAVSTGLHCRGIISGNNHSLAAISIFGDEVIGIISDSVGNFILGKLENDNEGLHVIYNDKYIRDKNPLQCFTSDGNDLHDTRQFKTPSATNIQTCIRLYWEVNYDIYQNKGSVANAINYVTGLFNQSAAIYTNDNIPVILSQVYVWDIPSPYTSTSTSGLLGQFQSYRNSFNGDLGHLLGFAGGGGVAAGFNGLCAANLDNSQCYSGISASYQNFPTYSWSVEVVTHEQGHLMGSRHTHACVWNGNNTAIDGCGPSAGYGYEGNCSGAPIPPTGGTIMSYCHLVAAGINFNNGFGPQPAAAILNKYNNASCLTNCSGGFCFAPNNLSSANITTTSATLNWDSVPGAQSYNIQYRISGTGTWTPASSPLNSFAANGLTPGSTYEWQVQTVCSGGNSAFTVSSYFITVPLSCNAPSGLYTTAISSSSATLNWNVVGGAVSYDVQYRQVSTVPWINNVSSTNSIAIFPLTPLTSYEWHVKSNCQGGAQSVNSVDSVFITQAPLMPVACYPFSGNANDASGNGHHGTLVGPFLTSDRFGNPNSAYEFDGMNDYISLGTYSNIIPSGNNFTLSVWIRADQVKIQTILMINPDNNSDRLNAMAYYDHSGVSSTFWDYGNILTTGRLAIIGTTFNFSWEHYAFVVNGSQNYMQVYKNGMLLQTKPSSSIVVNRNRELRIGGAFDTNFAPFFFDGRIDDMAIYNQALSQQEIQVLFAQNILCLNSVGINEAEESNEISLFPSISNDGLLHLYNRNSNENISLNAFNSFGKKVKGLEFSNAGGQIDLNFSDLAKGVYFFNIMTQKSNRTFKIILF